MFDFEIYGLNTPHFYNNIEEVELYHQHLNVRNRINNENSNEGTIPINEGKTFKNDLCTICLERIPNVLFCLCGHICICEKCNEIKKLNSCPICKTENNILRII